MNPVQRRLNTFAMVSVTHGGQVQFLSPGFAAKHHFYQTTRTKAEFIQDLIKCNQHTGFNQSETAQ